MQRSTTIRVLLDPITNPKPDGRKNDWTGAKQFPAGRYYVDEHCIRKVGAYRYASILNDWRGRSRGAEQYKAFMAASSEVAPLGIRELLLSLEGDTDGASTILGVLLLNGTITADHIQQAASQLDEDEELYERV